MLKKFYLISAIVGAIAPWSFFAWFFAAEGIDTPLFIESLFGNGAAAGFAVDVLISAVVFLVWSYNDSKKLNLRRWWILLPATFLVGLSLALPLYFYMREDATEKANPLTPA